MAQVVQHGSRQVRIGARDPRKLEYLPNRGLTWLVGFHGVRRVGAILDLQLQGEDIIVYAEGGTF